jgi:signal transduction histidine kinase
MMAQTVARQSGEQKASSDVASVVRGWAPPIRLRQFWIVQVLVLLIAAGHWLQETEHLLPLEHASFIPVSLYLLPVTYAGLMFGLRGSLPTAVWCFVLTLPNALLMHEGSELLAEFWQAGLVVAVGILVGRRVDGERRARADAQRRTRERRASEAKYRTVFDVAGDAIVLLDARGMILDANTAAAALFGSPVEELRRQPLTSVAPAGMTSALSNGPNGEPVGPVAGPDRKGRWLAPVQTQLADENGQAMRLVLLRDVSLQVERQRLLEDFAGRTIAAREEERRRVARELHDGPLQSVVLLSRSLDDLESADGDVTAALASARRTAEEVAAELRRFSRDLRPSVLDDLGLSAALRAEVAAFDARTGMTARFDVRGNPDSLDSAKQLTVLRVCQEALHNVERHARASRVAVRLSASSARTHLEVEDDGVGIAHIGSPSELVREGRMGMVGMQERARLVDGTCSIRPTKSGTVVQLTIPAHSPAH